MNEKLTSIRSILGNEKVKFVLQTAAAGAVFAAIFAWVAKTEQTELGEGPGQ